MLSRIAAELANKPLLCLPEYAETMVSFLGERIGVNAAGLQSGDFAARPASAAAPSGAAIIPVIGSLTHRASQLDAESGLRSYQAIGEELDAAMADNSVETIFLEFDTPGGTVSGAFDLADKIHAATKQKRVIAFVDGRCCSAGYLLASQASEIWATQTSEIGSIGVVMIHMDRSQQLGVQGVKPTFLFRGARKIDGTSALPLSAEAKASFEARIGEVYDMFVAAVARGRKMTPQAVTGTDAAVYSATAALAGGLINGIKSREKVLTGKPSAASAEQSSIKIDYSQFAPMRAFTPAAKPETKEETMTNKIASQQPYNPRAGGAEFTAFLAQKREAERAQAGIVEAKDDAAATEAARATARKMREARYGVRR